MRDVDTYKAFITHFAYGLRDMGGNPRLLQELSSAIGKFCIAYLGCEVRLCLMIYTNL